MLTNHTIYKHETQYKGPFLIAQCFTNGMVMLQCGAIQITYNIRHINPYKSDTKDEDFNPRKMYDAINI